MVDNIFHTDLVAGQPFATRLISSAVLSGKLAHAYLFVGRALEHKWDIARDLGCVLNCANVKDGKHEAACTLTIENGRGQTVDTQKFCQNCRWIWEGKHPQAWLTLTSSTTTKSGKIAVEKARMLSDELAKESHFTRIIVIEDASQDVFHRPAANALLKTIEDPKVSCVFLLFALSVEDVLPTVVSRCQVVPLLAGDSCGLSLYSSDLSAYNQEAVRLAREVVHKHIRRRDLQAVAYILEFARQFNELIGDELSGADAIDLLVTLELQHVGGTTWEHTQLSGYAAQLLAAAQASKEQLEHYVTSKAAMESFALSWWRLAAAVPAGH
jgi:hypothetical protein